MRETWVRSLGREDSPGEENCTPLQYSCLENPTDGGAWWATVHGITKSRTRLSDFTCTYEFHELKEFKRHIGYELKRNMPFCYITHGFLWTKMGTITESTIVDSRETMESVWIYPCNVSIWLFCKSNFLVHGSHWQNKKTFSSYS